MAAVTAPSLGDLTTVPALDRTDLLAPPVAAFLATWPHAGEVGVVEIDPDLADTAALVAAHDGLELTSSVNCVLVGGKRAGEERVAACLVRADTRADVNNVVKRTLDVRKASFLSMERAVDESGMEYGGITPIGLPADWRVLVDELVAKSPSVVIGAGIRGAKLWLPGRLLAELPGGEVLPGLGVEAGQAG
jgi:prolyl-tRNA editing enzyme YbaK/EbsC (Cys-tRNA(Pro) deacylase)